MQLYLSPILVSVRYMRLLVRRYATVILLGDYGYCVIKLEKCV